MTKTGNSTLMLLFMLTCAFTLLHGQNKAPTFSMESNKSQYYEFEYIYLKYVVKNGRPQNVNPPNIKGAKVVDYDVQEQSSSGMTITFNGKRVSQGENKVVITFVLSPEKTGRIEIPNTSINIDGKKYSANGFNVYVKSFAISEQQLRKDRFVKVEVSDRSPYVGEAISITYLLFTKDAFSSEDQLQSRNAFINFGDFTVRQIGEFNVSRVKIKNQNYYMVQIQSHLITPLTSGRKEIPSFDINYVTYQIIQEGFFGRKEAVKRSVDAPKTIIDVKQIPNLTSDFSGLVGDFNLSLTLDKEEVPINDAVTLKYVLSGKGNFEGFEGFQIELPGSWEVFEPKTENNFKAYSNGVSGELVYEYVAIPRRKGKYDLPTPKLKCFNPSSGKYYSILPDAQNILVTDGEMEGKSNQIVSSNARKEIDIKNEDIRYLKNDFELERHSIVEWPGIYVASISLLSLANLGLLLWPIIIGVRKDRLGEEVAIKQRLIKELKKWGESDDVHNLYDLFTRYLDRIIGIDLANQNKKNIKVRLFEIGVSEETINKVQGVLAKLEMSEYAKGSVNGSEIRNTIIEIIQSINNEN